MAGCFERGDELSGSMKYGDILCLAKEPLASQPGLCSMELLVDHSESTGSVTFSEHHRRRPSAKYCTFKM